MKTFGVSIIGTGYMAQKHAAALKELGMRLEDVCSSPKSLAKAQAMQSTYGFKRATDALETLLANSQTDMVLICTPDVTHSAMTVAALKAGKHVLCEKPLARTEAEFKAIASALKESDRTLQVGMNCRFREQYAIPKQKTDATELGDLRFLRGTYIANHVESTLSGQKAWMKDFPQGTHPFLHGGAIHCLDLLHWIGGPITSVFARARADELKAAWVKDTFSISLQFKNGALGELLSSATAFMPPDFHLDLWFSQGSILGKTLYRRKGNQIDLTAQDIVITQKKLDLVLEWEDLIAAIQSKRDPLNSFTQAYENFKILSAIEHSLQKGQPVSLEG